MNFIDRIPLPLRAIVTVLMLDAPFFPEPHLAQKWGILIAGTLTRPIDILDVLWHLLPAILFAVRIYRHFGHSRPH